MTPVQLTSTYPYIATPAVFDNTTFKNQTIFWNDKFKLQAN